MKFGQLIEYNKSNNFLQKLCKKWGKETSSRPLFIFQKTLKWGESKRCAAYIVCTIPFFLVVVVVVVRGGRELNLQLNFQKGGGGGLTGPQLLEVGYWEWGGDFFQARGGAHIFLKYAMTKKVYKQKIFFSVIINNSNWRFYLRI